MCRSPVELNFLGFGSVYISVTSLCQCRCSNHPVCTAIPVAHEPVVTCTKRPNQYGVLVVECFCMQFWEVGLWSVPMSVRKVGCNLLLYTCRCITCFYEVT